MSEDEEIREEATEETTTEEPSEPECIVIPEHMKPLFECCKEYDEGKIAEGDFFARTLVRMGEFMENVKKKREGGESEST